jgi:hypothetical protein
MYLYETHLHTAEVSRCARISAAEQVRYYKTMGFSGIIVTDHFLGGHTTVPENLPWERRVELFCEGYELAKQEGDRLALSVFFGWEYSYMGIDFLTYGLDQAWLLRHRDIDKLFINDYLDLVRGGGGYVVHAHPFREEAYIPMIQLLPRRVDAVEVCNANRTDFENRLAGEYAAAYGLKKSAGSDNHTGSQARLCVIGVNSRLNHLGDFIAAVQSSATDIVSMSGTLQRNF